MKSRGLGALTGARVKEACGFGLGRAGTGVRFRDYARTLCRGAFASRADDAEHLTRRLADDEIERPSIFLTNALTGWEPEWDPGKNKATAFSRTQRRTRPRRGGKAKNAHPRNPRQSALQWLCRYGGR